MTRAPARCAFRTRASPLGVSSSPRLIHVDVSLAKKRGVISGSHQHGINRVGLSEGMGDFLPARRLQPGRFAPQRDAGLFTVRRADEDRTTGPLALTDEFFKAERFARSG